MAGSLSYVYTNCRKSFCSNKIKFGKRFRRNSQKITTASAKVLSCTDYRERSTFKDKWHEIAPLRQRKKRTMKEIQLIIVLCLGLVGCNRSLQITQQSTAIPLYDIVLQNGRIIDPASQIDTILNIGIQADTIAIISEEVLNGKQIIDATNLVVAPGFIDLHSHTPTPLGQWFQLQDGVTTALDLEAGAFPQSGYGEFLQDGAWINYGASVGYFAIRIKVMEGKDEPYIFSPKGAIHPQVAFTQKATPEQINKMSALLHKGLEEGGIGIGLLLDYMDQAISPAELEMIFEVSAQYKAPIWVHIRRGVQGDPAGLEEMISLSRDYRASVHICHLQANAMGQIASWLERIDEANRYGGADISVEMYPYTAGSTSISADVFDRDWQNIFGITYEDVQWSDTGEYLTKETWEKYRKEQPTGAIIHHYGKEEWNQISLKHPQVMIASDAMPVISRNRKVTPRGNGTFSKILGKYVREEQLMTLPEAIAKMTYLPARRLEKIAPIFSKKGRLSVGAHADIVIFDPVKIQDHGTYENPYQPSTGLHYVLIGGRFVMEQEKVLNDTFLGRHLSLKIR